MWVIAATVVITWPLAALSDGTHKAKIKIINKNCYNVEVKSWNGDKSGCGGKYHKIVFPAAGDSEAAVLKCHGKGKHRCFVTLNYSKFWGAEDTHLLRCEAVPKDTVINLALVEVGSGTGECEWEQ